MTNSALENNIFMLSEKNEHERNKIKRVLKSQWLSDYAPDIFKTMKESELRRRPILFKSTQFDKRPMLIQLCHFISRTYKLGHCTQHLAIYYLDRFFDYYTIRADKLQLIAMTCMHIAAQIEHTDVNVPRYSEMNSLIKSGYTSFEFKAVERKLLTFFDFKLIRPTVASFVEMFAWNFITNDDYISYCKGLDELDKATADANVNNYPRFSSFEQMLAKLALVLMRMSDYTLSINRFINKPPSLLAASCIAATRKVSGLTKRWTPLLTELTSYNEQMVEPYVNVITQFHYMHELSNLKAQEQQQQQHQQQQRQAEIIWPSPDSGFGDNLSESQLKIIPLELGTQMEVVSVEVETFNVITVKLQELRKQISGTVKRSHDNDCEEEQKNKRLKLDKEQK